MTHAIYVPSTFQQAAVPSLIPPLPPSTSGDTSLPSVLPTFPPDMLQALLTFVHVWVEKKKTENPAPALLTPSLVGRGNGIGPRYRVWWRSHHQLTSQSASLLVLSLLVVPPIQGSVGTVRLWLLLLCRPQMMTPVILQAGQRLGVLVPSEDVLLLPGPPCPQRSSLSASVLSHDDSFDFEAAFPYLGSPDAPGDPVDIQGTSQDGVVHLDTVSAPAVLTVEQTAEPVPTLSLSQEPSGLGVSSEPAPPAMDTSTAGSITVQGLEQDPGLLPDLIMPQEPSLAVGSIETDPAAVAA